MTFCSPELHSWHDNECIHSLHVSLQMCIFAGCDFLKALPGIGMKKAHQHVKRLKAHRKVYHTLCDASEMFADVGCLSQQAFVVFASVGQYGTVSVLMLCMYTFMLCSIAEPMHSSQF